VSPPPTVAAIVLGWNLVEESRACLASLEAQGYEGLQFIYVDNGSTDGAPARIAEEFPNAAVIALPRNEGIAGGYNAGLERVRALDAEYAFILNNDTIVAPGALAALVAAARDNPRAGLLMPKIPFEGDRGRIWSAGQRRRGFPPGVAMIGLRQIDGPAYAEQRDLEYAPSCALLISRACLETVVPAFDPRYFFYYSDTEYCERVRRAGLTIRYVPEAVVYHKVSLSTTRSAHPAPWYYEMGRSTARYYTHYMPPVLLTLGSFGLWFLARETIQGNARRLPLFLRGIRDEMIGRPP